MSGMQTTTRTYRSATDRHVVEVQNVDTVCELVLADDPDSTSTSSGGDRRLIVHLHLEVVAGRLDETHGLGGGLGDVVDEAFEEQGTQTIKSQ
jgi:hypothetical protein